MTTKASVKRTDPKMVPTGGVTKMGEIIPATKKPGYRYVGARPGSQFSSPEFYGALGYELCVHQKGGERLMGVKEPPEGQPLEFMGHVYMRVPEARWEEIQRKGIYGNTGMELLDVRDRKIYGEDGVQPGTLMKGAPAPGNRHFNIGRA